ncbi:hypothetical protein SNEBB_001904 [Seison nebaliae]|nr:hypothetical protein SNEBB_001904 [Seison nebaliae]
MDKIKQAVGIDNSDDSESNILGSLNEFSTLSYTTRLKGFAASFILGLLLVIIGIFCLYTASLTPFVVCYTLGTICGLLSTAFLRGPLQQLRDMTEWKRITTTLILLGCIIMTLVSALVIESTILTLIFGIAQGLVLCWYALSYIPFARDFVKKTCGSCI